MAKLGALRKSIIPGTVLRSNSCGKYEFIEEVESKIIDNKTIRYAKIKFLETGTEKIVRMSSIFSGMVKDPYRPTIAGVGYIGEMGDRQYTKKEYDMWRTMIIRCYDRMDPAYKYYGNIGIKVCDRWHCFTNFLDDLQNLPGYNEYIHTINNGAYAIDKDIKQSNIPHNQRIYSPETCMIIKKEDNSRSAGYSNKKAGGSIYHGVHKLASNGNYQSRIRIKGEDFFLGTYDNEIAAANMYNYYASLCEHAGIIMNNVEFMSITECLKHRTSNTPIKVPNGVKCSEITMYNRTLNMEQGVHPKSNGNYTSVISMNGSQFYIGSFDNQVAACNAYNWYSDFYNINGRKNIVPYMPVDEWVRHRVYANGTEQLYHTVQQDDEERKACCLKRYGIEF